MLKHFFLLGAAVLCTTISLQSCNDDDSYAELREQENKQIAAFIKNGAQIGDSTTIGNYLKIEPIKVISETEFYAQDSTTNLDKNEYVLFGSSGVYMQIVRKGTGAILQQGESVTAICRYLEYNIAGDSIQSTNRILTYEVLPDIMTASNSSGTITGQFISGVMTRVYSSTSVPAGWLIPLKYIKLGRQASADESIALVRLIVPSTQGQVNAQATIYPCFYEISFERSR